MIPVFENPTSVEKLVKEKYAFPPFIMMEHAAEALSDYILAEFSRGTFSGNASYDSVIFLCGKGNNGADGLTTARLLFSKIPVYIYCPEPLKTEEGLAQDNMCRKLKIPRLTLSSLKNKLASGHRTIIIDCIYGTGFHGELTKDCKSLLDLVNASDSFRIACDISSALYFKAHCTVTMGTLKKELFSDKGKEASGFITLAELGLDQSIFENCGKTDLFLLSPEDIKLPVRRNKNSHKGTFGHSVIMAGEKSGAALLSAEASMTFGSGLTSVYKCPFSNLTQFKINPELMITDIIPGTTKAVQIGSGLGSTEKADIQKEISIFENWFCKKTKPAAVIDADMFSFKGLPALLKNLNQKKEGRIVLTPHPKELASLASLLGLKNLSPSEALEDRISIGKSFTKKYSNIVLVMKGANTFIAYKGKTYIYEGGSQSLSKGGSGDVLAGMITSLLAQGYTALEAAITAVWHHGETASALGPDSYNLTPKKLIKNL